MRIGINGFGRIGRLALRSAFERRLDLDIVAINDRGDAAINAHMLRFDSTYGPFAAQIEARDDRLTVEGHPIQIFSHLNPLKIPWYDLGVELVIEATGVFTEADQAAAHLEAGATRVLVTAPSKGADATLVIGVNEGDYDPGAHRIVSGASCTTNALAPVAKALHEEFGIHQGMMSTIHAYTNDQRILDRSHTDPRRARAAAANIIPTSTGATRALGEVLPALAGRFHGISYRVPMLTVSLIDLVVELERRVSAEEVSAAVAAASNGPMRWVLGYSDLPLVSSDFRGNSHSSIVDGLSTATLDGGNLVRVVAWYDNEWAYASRIGDFASYLSAVEGSSERPYNARVVRPERIDEALVLAGFHTTSYET